MGFDSGSRAAAAAEALRRNRRDYLTRLFGSAGVIRGQKFEIGDVHGNAGKSFTIPLNRPDVEDLKDFGNGFSGDDLDVVAQARGLSIPEAIALVESWGFLAPTSPRPNGKSKPKPNGSGQAHHGPAAKSGADREAPAKAAPRSSEHDAKAQKHPKMGLPDSLYDYYDAAGKPVAHVARWEARGGRPKKEFRPLCFKAGKWSWTDPEGKWPVYNLPEVAAFPEREVLIVEGEKTAEAARELLPKHVVTTWAHGAGSSAKTDWSPLKGRRCVIWPDNDGSGKTAAREVAASLLEVAATEISIVQPPDVLPVKWDLADPLPEGFDIEDVELAISTSLDIGVARDRELGIVSAFELEHLEFAPPKFIVADLLTEGLSLMAGSPKMGKSWLALGIADAISRGVDFFTKHEAEAGDVLYMGLEDNLRRMQSRLRKVRGRASASPRLHFVCNWQPLDQGGLEDLAYWLDRHPNAKLVVVDTFAIVREAQKRNANAYQSDYDSLRGLKRLADKHHICLLLIHHLRKSSSDDPFDRVSGTSGITGSMDTSWVLKRDRGEDGATLHVTGRDIVEAEKALQFNEETCVWEMLGNASEFRRTNEQSAVLRTLQEAPPGGMTPKEVAAAIGESYENVKMRLWRLNRDGDIANNNGRYSLRSGQ